jgi:hypothetical protein
VIEIAIIMALPVVVTGYVIFRLATLHRKESS